MAETEPGLSVIITRNTGDYVNCSIPIMTAEDANFGSGWVGFGSFDDTGKVDNVRIWAPSTPEMKAIPFFQSAAP